MTPVLQKMPQYLAAALSALLVILSSVSDATAQMRWSGSKPTLLSPKPLSPLQSRIGAPGEQSPAPTRPTLNFSPIDPGPIGAETTTNIYFAQVAVGGGYTTVFTLMNTGSTTAAGNLIATGQDGLPFNLNLNEPAIRPEAGASAESVGATGSSFPISVPPGGTKFFTATPLSAGDPTTSLWVRVESAGGNVAGVGTFQQVEGGVLKTIAGVLSSQPVPFATIPVDNDDSSEVQRFTGYAVANVSNENISIRLVTLNENGQIVDNVLPSVLNPLGPRMQVARFVFQDLPSRLKFKGSMVLVGQSGKTFVAVALVLQQGLLSAVPVVPEKASIVPN